MMYYEMHRHCIFANPKEVRPSRVIKQEVPSSPYVLWFTCLCG